MNELNLQPGDSVEYKNGKYTVVENRIVKGKQKQRKMILINVLAIVIMVLIFVLCATGMATMGKTDGTFSFGFGEFAYGFLIIAAAFIVFIVAHEYVHYLTYRIAGKSPKDSLKFGVVLKSGMAYCISLVPNTVKASRLSLMMPFYVLVIPIIILAIVLQSVPLTFMAALFASGSAGDFWYMWTLRKDSRDKYIIEAMPEGNGYEIGYLVLEKIED